MPRQAVSMNVDLTVGSGGIVRVRTSSVPPYSSTEQELVTVNGDVSA